MRRGSRFSQLWRWGVMVAPIVLLVATCKSPNSGSSSGAAGSGNAGSGPGTQAELTGGTISSVAAEMKNAGSINEGPFLGGPTGTKADASTVITPASLTSSSIPVGGSPSPLFGAEPFSQHLLLFEEFGSLPMVAPAANPVAFPQLVDSSDPNDSEHGSPKYRSAPDKVDIEALMGEPGLNPPPSRTSNITANNPWWPTVCDYLKNPQCAGHPGPAEGRPPGDGWAHQRWDEFPPQRYFKTSQSGARENLGVRDSMQQHKYTAGEFGPGGLYHNTVGAPGFDGTTKGIKPQFHPNFPVQDFKKLWTFDGTFPLKLLMARYDEAILFRHYNFLPIDVSANGGFGNHTITTHEHNGHNPAESDGFAGAYFFPGQFYDYHWPMVVAGHDSINNTAVDPMMGTPCGAGETINVRRAGKTVAAPCDVSKDPNHKVGSIKVQGDYREVMSTHWFHDHMIDFTSKNVYKGNAAMMNYYSAIDRGNESLNDGVNLKMPSGSAMPWGNRDYDINLAIGDKSWDKDGQLWFNPFDTDGFIADQVLVNMTWKPILDVRARRYRFRILNASVARYYKMAIVREVAGNGGSMPGPAGSNVSYEIVPFHMIGNDGNIMEHSVAFDGTLGAQKGILPTHAIAERYDIIVDFAKNGINPGDKLYFVNTLEHTNGRLPNKQIDLGSILNESYKAVVAGDRWTNGDPAVGKIMRFDVKPCMNAGNPVTCVDPSLDPARYVENNKNGPGGTALKLLPRPSMTAADLAGARHHTYDFVRGSGADNSPWTVKVDGNGAHGADTRRVSVATSLADVDPAGQGRVQIWHIKNSSGGWSHPVHVHFEEGQILSRGGKAPPIWEKYARKDLYRVGPEADSTGSVDLAIRVREFGGTYVEHCHNTTHEDNAMLIRWDSEKPGQTKLMPTPAPSWYGVNLVDSVAEETFRNGDPSLMTSTFISRGNGIDVGQTFAVNGKGANCSMSASMQADGNFVVFRGSKPVWSSNTAGKAVGGRAVMGNDGLFKILRSNGTVQAQFGNPRAPGFRLVLIGNGRFGVVNAAGAYVWSPIGLAAGCAL